MEQTKIKIHCEIFPLLGVELSGEHKIKDHINLSGSSPNIGFNPIGELYIDKHSNDGIIVACLKPGIHPTKEEAELLKANGVKAYSYSLIEPALYAAANNQQVEAIGYVPKIPKGFNLFGVAAGIKQADGVKDLAVIYSSEPCLWAGTFTKNLARAVCVEKNSKLHSAGGKVRALISNAGNANACTGAQGESSDKQMREVVAKKFQLNVDEVLSASTGKIGVQLPIEKVINAVNDLGAPKSEMQSVIDFAEAVLTTDLVLKISQDANANMLGFTKGSGMIMPNMATMLAYIISDVKIQGLNDEESTQEFFREALSRAVAQSFNLISVDGDTSTNDMVIFMSNLQGKEISPDEFKASLEEVCKDLAFKIVADGEGLTKIIQLKLSGSISKMAFDLKPNLEKIGRKIINSPLVKTAIFGNDPNWGRIIASAGQAASEHEIKLDPNEISLSILGHEVFAQGMPTEFIQSEENKAQLVGLMKKNKIIEIDLAIHDGKHSVTMLGNDLSHDYIKINAEYST